MILLLLLATFVVGLFLGGRLEQWRVKARERRWWAELKDKEQP